MMLELIVTNPTFEDLRSKVLAWGHDRDIVKTSDSQVIAQFSKVKEELAEVDKAIRNIIELRYSDVPKTKYLELEAKYRKELELEFGDLLVTIIMTCACAQLNPTEALSKAYEKISNRTGKVVNGVFVKD